MRIRLAVVAVAAALAGAGAAWLARSSEIESMAALGSGGAILALVVGWCYVASGLVVWRHRPEDRLGPIMLGVGFAWFATFLAAADEPLAFTAGTALENVYLAAFVYLILSFPSGRLRTRLDRGLVLAGAALATAVQLSWMAFADSRAVICAECPANALQIARHDAVAEAILQAQRFGGIVFSLLTVTLLVARWRRASAPQRRSVAPVLWTGGATLVVLGVSAVDAVAGEPLEGAPEWALALVFACIPLAVMAVSVQHRLARGAVAGLVVELGERGRGVDLRDALRRALGDPRLELAYWIPASGRYVGADGRLIEIPQPDADRVATVVERDGRPVAALIHDSALRDNAELVDSVCAAAGLTLENERLQAELRARLSELQASRARLVEATESERRRIERDLHDGTQQRLVSIAMTLGLAESRAAGDPASVSALLREARGALAIALEELRELSQGIHPGILTERGLAAALDDLARRAALPVRLELSLDGRPPRAVEAAAYFVASEALTNAVKHSHGSEVVITAARAGDVLVVEVRDDGIGGASAADGSGLRGLTDRVEALGGRLTVASPPGRGTTLRAELPCA